MSPKTILVVDDDAGMLVVLQKRLEHAGYRVLTATDAVQALDWAESEHVDAISLDVRLPGDIDGLELAVRFRSNPLTGGIPIIFITGSADDTFGETCRAAGGRCFLAKPYDPDLLIQVLRNIFGADELGEMRRISQAKRRQPVR
jgi:CheY-like chemotaxis protein